LYQSLCCSLVSTPQNTKVFLRIETRDRLDLGKKSYF
jgi:hypothetical protein